MTTNAAPPPESAGDAFTDDAAAPVEGAPVPYDPTDAAPAAPDAAPDAAPAKTESADTQPAADFSALGSWGNELAARHGWTSMEQAIEYLQTADTERGRMRNEAAELRKQNEHLSSVLDSFIDTGDTAGDSQDDGPMSIDWDAVEKFSGEPIPASVRMVIDQGLPVMLQDAEQRIMARLESRLGDTVEPLQRYIGGNAVRDEARALTQKHPGLMPLVADRVIELVQSDGRYNRPGGIGEAFEKAVAERALQGLPLTAAAASAAPAQPAAVASPGSGGADSDLLGGGNAAPPPASQELGDLLRQEMLSAGGLSGIDAFS